MNLPPPPVLDYRPPHAPYLAIAYSDAHVIVIDKPQGLLSVPGKGDHLADCVAARAKAAFPVALIVHRIDLDTGGLLMLARSKDAQRILSGQFEKRIIEKTYMAEVWGAPADDSGTIDLPMRVDWPNRPRQMVCHEEGRSAVTDWVVERRGETSLMRLHPKTGRSHQLRVHMAAIGHQILGDSLYATGPALQASPKLRLFATQIRWRCPGDGTWREVNRFGGIETKSTE